MADTIETSPIVGELQNGHADLHKRKEVEHSSSNEDDVAAAKRRNGAYGPIFDEPSITEIKAALPKRLFCGDLQKSMYYVVKDLSIITALYISILVVDAQPFTLLKFIYTPVYWFFQGTMMWSVFVLGHDCGHESFSNYSFLNDVLGTFLHSIILVPFYPWKLTHRHHHKNTGNIDKDEIFYPVRESEWNRDYKPLKPAFLFGTSWFIYLCTGYAPRKVHHLNPLDDLFSSHVVGCVCSLAGCSGTLYVLWQYFRAYGLQAVVSHYGVPCWVFASWLVVVTFLHHTEIGVPWYADGKWNYVRGQLSSVDRHYGWAHELTHNIGTHQIHHLFTKVPHYNLEEATRIFREKWPQHVRQCNDSIMTSFLRMFHIFDQQRHIKDDTEVITYSPIKTS